MQYMGHLFHIAVRVEGGTTRVTRLHPEKEKASCCRQLKMLKSGCTSSTAQSMKLNRGFSTMFKSFYIYYAKLHF